MNLTPVFGKELSKHQIIHQKLLVALLIIPSMLLICGLMIWIPLLVLIIMVN